MTGQTSSEKISLTQGFTKAALGLVGFGSAMASMIALTTPDMSEYRTALSACAGIGFTSVILAIEPGALTKTFRKVGPMTSAITIGLLIGGLGYYVNSNNEQSKHKWDAAFKAVAPIQPGDVVQATAQDLFCKNSYKGEEKIIEVNGQKRALICA